MIKKAALLILLLNSGLLFAQEQSAQVEMADGFRANGKIYIVIATILVIFSILISYLVRLDKKLNNLDK
jgi:hypothetical protein